MGPAAEEEKHAGLEQARYELQHPATSLGQIWCSKAGSINQHRKDPARKTPIRFSHF